MSKVELYKKYGEKIADELRKAGVQITEPAARRLCGYIVNLIEEVKKPKGASGKSHGAEIWDKYSEAFEYRYGTRPVRNAQTNGQAARLAERLGLEDGKSVVEFYLKQNDAYYVRSYHSLGLCLKDSETLWTKQKTGTKTTRRSADKVERASASASAISTYMEKKNGMRTTKEC